MEYHNLDIYPEPQDKKPLFINEPWLVDPSFYYLEKMPEEQVDNVRVYVPLDISAEDILRRLSVFVYHYGEANEDNESDFSNDVRGLVSQIEIYDQVWMAREQGAPAEQNRSYREDWERKHSPKTVDLVKRFVEELEAIPDGCAELFPFELIDELKEEYLAE